MSSLHFPAVRRWQIPSSAYAASLAEMSQDGRRGNEGVALWFGRRQDGLASVTHAVLLRGPGVMRGPDFLHIDASVINDVTDLAIELGVALVGQIHSHGRAWTDLSPTDRSLGIVVPYYLSIVAPHYGMRATTRLQDCGVHVYGTDRTWRRMSPSETNAALLIVPGAVVPVLTVGEDA